MINAPNSIQLSQFDLPKIKLINLIKFLWKTLQRFCEEKVFERKLLKIS